MPTSIFNFPAPAPPPLPPNTVPGVPAMGMRPPMPIVPTSGMAPSVGSMMVPYAGHQAGPQLPSGAQFMPQYASMMQQQQQHAGLRS